MWALQPLQREGFSSLVHTAVIQRLREGSACMPTCSVMTSEQCVTCCCGGWQGPGVEPVWTQLLRELVSNKCAKVAQQAAAALAASTGIVGVSAQ